MKHSRQKTVRRFCHLLVVVSILAILVLTAGNLWVILSTQSRIIDSGLTPKGDCIIVLGCGITKAGEPGQHLSLRMDKAIELYQKGAAPKILVSGDHGRQDYDEVNAMKRYAVRKGVPAQDVFMDHAGFSTYETMVRAAQMFDVHTPIIVTQPFHIYRSVYDAKTQGMNAAGVSADKAADYPQTQIMLLELREALARCKDILYCLFRVDVPTVSDMISIAGSGTATDDAYTQLWLRDFQD